jgi:hypothetical protein
MPHNFKYSRLSKYDSKLNFPSLLVTNESRCYGSPSVLSLWRVSPRESERIIAGSCAAAGFRMTLT